MIDCHLREVSGNEIRLTFGTFTFASSPDASRQEIPRQEGHRSSLRILLLQLVVMLISLVWSASKTLLYKESFVFSTDHLESHLEPFKHTRHFRLSNIENLALTEMPAIAILSRILNHSSLLSIFQISSAKEHGFRRVAIKYQLRPHL